MSPELLIVKYLLDKTHYSIYYPSVEKHIQDKDFKIILNSIGELFDLTKKDTILLEELSLYLQENKDNKLLGEVVLGLSSVDIDEHVLSSVLDSIKTRSDASELAILALEVSDGKRDKQDIIQFVSDILSTASTVETEDSVFVSTNLQDLYEQQVSKQGLRWRLDTLNKMMGSLRKGDFGFLFARPEVGKTTFLASEITHFAEQVETPILWFNNEEQGGKVAIRLYQAALGKTQDEIFHNIELSQADYSHITNDNIKIFDSASIHKNVVERLCKEYQPSLVIFDQIDKIKGFTADREDLHLGAIYIWARELAKQYCPVIGVCQASGEGEGKSWLTMEHVSGAKTAKQAEADWILGIGKRNDEGYETTRYLHLSKNKLAGDRDTDPQKRHGREMVLIKPQVARYEDIVIKK